MTGRRSNQLNYDPVEESRSNQSSKGGQAVLRPHYIINLKGVVSAISRNPDSYIAKLKYGDVKTKFDGKIKC